MRVLIDTNVVLDVLLNRTPWVTEAKAVWQAHNNGRITGYITTITDIFYIARRLKNLGPPLILQYAFEICEVNRTTLEQAETLSGRYF